MSEYYDILGINKDTDIKDIRRAYKRLAFKWHPDKNPQNKKEATKKFKAISEAYQTLSDPEKKRQYDMFGKSDNTYSNVGIDPFDLFSKLFGENSLFGVFDSSIMNMFKQSFTSKSKQKHGTCTQYDLYCSIEDLYYGTTKKIRLTRTNYCNHPSTIESEIKEVSILPGWKDGTKITFNNTGDIHPHTTPCDVIFIIKTQIHDVYEKIDYDLYIDCNISLYEALNGFTRIILTLKNTKETIDIDSIYSTNKKYLLKGHGMPIRKNRKIVGYGDMIVRFAIVLDNIDDAKKKLISNILKY